MARLYRSRNAVWAPTSIPLGEASAEPDTTLGVWGECFDFNIDCDVWLSLLTIGQAYGWQPAGTQAPEDWPVDESNNTPRDRSYFPPQGQVIKQGDAKALAAALVP